MSIFARYQRICETKENHRDEKLITHYYKGTYKQIFDIVETTVKQNDNYVMGHLSKEHGEISVNLKRGRQSFLIITVVAVKPLEIAVDLHISTESYSLFGSYPFLKKQVVDFYQKLNQAANFIGKGRG
ncbi:hypothetical protein [Pseudoneobacillus sp. C159]